MVRLGVLFPSVTLVFACSKGGFPAFLCEQSAQAGLESLCGAADDRVAAGAGNWGHRVAQTGTVAEHSISEAGVGAASGLVFAAISPN